MWKLILVAAMVVLSLSANAASTLFDYGSSWKYKIGSAEASDPITAWRTVAYDDSSWPTAPAPIGYSTSPNNGFEESIATSLPTSNDAGYLSLFFRRNFTINNPAAVNELTLNVVVDDGFVVWINGAFVGLYNVGDQNVRFDSFALDALEPSIQTITLSGTVKDLLRPGQNVIAVQLFNANFSSSDLVFDASLSSDLDEIAPAISALSPSPSARVRELTVVDVTFTEPVTGVEAADLLVNGTPALSMEATSPLNYVFRINPPADGLVTVAWAGNHGITDNAAVPNSFGGGNWSYTVDSTAPIAKVVISEFMATNENGLRDEDGTRSDWIELFNSSNLSVNLDGWFLTDDAGNLAKWRIPGVTLGAGNYLLIWASGKNKLSAGSPLHTNFRLAKSGSFLALVDSSTNIVSSFGAGYPAQRDDISYGRDVVDSETTGYFSNPTPGSRNLAVGTGFAPEPIFSRDSGVYNQASFSVTITAPAGQIRYTLDGSVPTSSSTLYASPITVNGSATIKARVFQAGLLPSEVVGRVFTMVDNSIANFSSTLPVVIFNTGGRGIVSDVQPGGLRTFASVAILDTYRGRSAVQGPIDYIGYCELEQRGQTSAGFPKKPYNMELQNVYRFDEKAEILDFPAGSDFALINPYSDKPFLQNFLAYELHEKMGHYAVRRRFVEVFLNTSSSKVGYSHYAGIYLLVEKIRADNNRVDIAELSPGMNSEPEISGGYIFKKDKDSAGDLAFSTSGGAGFSGQYLKIHEPKPREISTEQLNWLRNYLNQMERAMYASNWRTATGTNHYSHYLDVDSFVDYHWIVEFAKQIDGYRLSNYMSKDRGGKVKMEPIWDWNLSFGNADYLTGESPSGWYYSQIDENAHIWLRRLISGTTSASGTSGDPDFNQKIADRWSVLRTNIMNEAVVLARIDEMAAILAEPAERDFAKYPRLGQYVWPNSSIYVTPTTYAGIISALKGWISDRYRWIDSQFLKPPTISLNGGFVPANTTVSLSGTGGTIYYTTDGSDPRVSGGGLSSRANAYNSPITISQNTKVVARIRSGSRWSGPLAATFTVQRPSLSITEIMYHPAMPPAGSVYTDEDFEFIELRNSGTSTLPLDGYQFVEGIQFTFPARSLAPGERVLVVKNRAAFESRYGNALPVAGEFTGSLDNAGEMVTLAGALGEFIQEIEYSDQWQPLTDGPGFSLVLADENSSPAFWGASTAWNASSRVGGTPGTAEPASVQEVDVFVNEVAANPLPGGQEQIELFNGTGAAVDISGWWLTDNVNTPGKFRLPAGSIIPAGGFLVVHGESFSPAFNLSSQGEEVYLFSADAAGTLTGYRHGIRFDASEAGGSYGRYLGEEGGEIILPQAESSFGSINQTAGVSSVGISEVMYRPPDLFLNNAFWNNTEDEYIEIWNSGATNVSFFDAANPGNTWRVTGAVNYSFPGNISLQPLSGLLLVSFDPVKNPQALAAFRSRYNVPAGVQVLGPYSGTLPNGSGTITLRRPLPPVTTGNDAGTVPYLQVEKITYSDSGNWPAGADGLGHALTRVSLQAWGFNSSNWVAASPSPGMMRPVPVGPVITQQPNGAHVQPSSRLTLNAAATGAGVLRYQWRHNGINLPWGTNATLTLTNTSAAQAGEYRVVISDTAGSTSSQAAFVHIGIDSDNDQIPDQWEIATGGNPYSGTDALVDGDLDGLSNVAEYFAGTDPNRAASTLGVEGITVGSEKATISFVVQPQRSYQLQFSNAVAGGTWQTIAIVSGRLEAHRALLSHSSAGSMQGFYRLVVAPQ